MLKACSISRNINKEAVEILKSKDINVDVWSGEQKPNKEELTELINIYDILIIGVKEKISKDMIQNIRDKKIIASMSIGLDHIAQECLNSEFIDVVNCPTSNVISVAEHIFALILDLSKKIKEANALVLEGKGDKKYLHSKPTDISSKTIGLIGAGNITKKIIDIANVFDMNIICNTLNPEKHQELKNKGVTFVNLDELLKQADIVNVSVPLTDKTRNMISREKIQLLKEDSIFINTSRGEVADVKALVEYADKNPNFYLGLDIDIDNYADVLSKDRNNVIATPHIAGCTDEAIQRTYIECAKGIVKQLEKWKDTKEQDER